MYALQGIKVETQHENNLVTTVWPVGGNVITGNRVETPPKLMVSVHYDSFIDHV